MRKLSQEERELIKKDFKTGEYNKKQLAEKYNCSYDQIQYCFRQENQQNYRKKRYRENKEEINKQAKIKREKNKEINKQQRKIYYERNKEKIKQKRKEYFKKNKEVLKKRRLENYKNNKEEINRKRKEYFNKNKERIREQNKKRYKIRREDPSVRIYDSIRNYMRKVILSKSSIKSLHTIELLGCDKKTIREHIEKQFKEGMSWDNYGEWHIDHIIPCEAFDFTILDHQKKCFNYKNLQPKWANENIVKSDYLPNGKKARDCTKEELEKIINDL